MSKSRSIMTDVAGLAAGGAIAAKFSNMTLPSFIPQKAAPFIPILGGFFLAKNKNPMFKAIGAGMIAVGSVKVISVLAPGLGISAIEDMEISDYVIEGGDPLQYALNGPGDGKQYNANYALSGNASGGGSGMYM